MAPISTPAQRLAEASNKIDKLYGKLVFSDAFSYMFVHGQYDAWDNAMLVIASLCRFQNIFRKLSRVAELANREDKRICKHSQAVVTSRQEQQARRMQAATETAGRPSLEATFGCFPNLPAELRLMIWEAASQPPRCHRIVSILETARSPSRDEAAASAVQMAGAHNCDPAGLLYHGDDLGLWAACRESRAIVMRAHTNAHARFAQKQALQSDSCSGLVNAYRLRGQRRRVRWLNSECIKFLKDVRDFDSGVKTYLLPFEHILRQLPKTKVQAGTQTGVQTSDSVSAGSSTNRPPTEEDNTLLNAIRELYELEGDFPKSADDGEVPVTMLKRRCRELNLGYLLGVPWA